VFAKYTNEIVDISQVEEHHDWDSYYEPLQAVYYQLEFTSCSEEKIEPDPCISKRGHEKFKPEESKN